jgi:site-specific DNA-methyltransferase (adenine-specific)
MEEGEPYYRKQNGRQRCNHHGYGFKNEGEIDNKGTRYPKSVLRISRDFSAQQQVHPTQKPVPLMEWLVQTYSNKGDIILDPYMGSGSTGVAAVKHGRKFIGIERSKEYYEIAKERCEAAKNDFKPTLFGKTVNR